MKETNQHKAVYFVWHNRAHNADKIREYESMTSATLAPYNHEMLVFDKNSEVIEGDPNLPRTIIIKFDSRETAMAWYNSPAYQEALRLRLEGADGFAVLVDEFVPSGK